MENKETENIVKMNGKGVFITPPQDIYIDEEGNTKEVVFEITRMIFYYFFGSIKSTNKINIFAHTKTTLLIS